MTAPPATEMIALDALPERCPEWPLSPWTTGELIRKGCLRCVRVGRRIYVTRQHLAEFIQRGGTPG